MKKYIVSSNDHVTDSTVLLTLDKAKDEQPIIFRPGQYAAIGFHRHGRPTPMRCFSIASSPLEAHTLQFGMRHRGHFTRGVAALQPGDEVIVEGPYGGFVLDDHRDLKTVLLAGGIGVTPFMSMVRYAAKAHISNEIRLLYSCATQDDIPFFDELKHLMSVNPHFKVIFFIGSGPVDRLSGQHVYSGRITAEITDIVASKLYTDKTFFICGPPPFMRGMTKLLRDRGTPMELIMTEAFSQGPNRQTGKIRSWPINIYVLGALGTVLASFIVMVVDVFRTLPVSSLSFPTQNRTTSPSTNGRQRDLDQLVNNFQSVTNTAPASSSTIPKTITQTVAASSAAGSSSAGSSSSSTKSATTVASTSGTTTTTTNPTPSPTPTPAPTPTPTPKPPPVCTTSPSGVTTCK